MPDSSDNVNARDGASIVWGPEIRVDGKRPEWLANDVNLLGQNIDGCYTKNYPGWELEAGAVEWECAQSIRLPADHPHYSKAPTTPELDRALWDRMVALVRKVAAEDVPLLDGPWMREARGIVADLPKPVDPDEQYAANLIRAQGWQGEGSIGEAAVLSMIAKAHRDGRQLATPEVSHVG